MIMQAKVAGILSRVQIDTGAEIDRTYVEFWQRDKKSNKSENTAVDMENESTEKLRITQYPLAIKTGIYTQKFFW